MRTSIALFAISSLPFNLVLAAYTLQDDYSTNSFFSMFDFFTADDPTHGYVNFVDQGTATASGLAGTQNGQIYMGVDTKSVASGRGRNSVRLTSKKSYNAGSLIILDLAHMPGSVCGTWPAFWTVGPNWPNNGEIDIIEGVNTQNANHYALHTSSGCSISNTGAFSGSIDTPNCDVNAAGQPGNVGCGIKTSDMSSYGDGFNAQHGGVYATEFTSSSVSIYFFPRSGIPADIGSGSPDPSGWGKPHAQFGGSACNVGQFVKQQQIVFDTTFCGDWAGNVWSTDQTCSAKAGSCQDFVKNNPSAFQESYWRINSLKVYSGSGGGAVPTTPVNTFSQKPTIGGGVPTGFPSVPGPPSSPEPSNGIPQEPNSFIAQPPQPTNKARDQPQGQPQAPWGGNNADWNRLTVSGWDDGPWQQGKANTVPTSTAAGVPSQFYNIDAAGATPIAANNAVAEAGGDNPNIDTQQGNSNIYTPASNSQPQPQDTANKGQDQDQTPPQPQDQNQGGVGQDQGPVPINIDPGTPSITVQASKTCGTPWVRSSWSGRYVTVTALEEKAFEHAKRASEEEDDILRRRGWKMRC